MKRLIVEGDWIRSGEGDGNRWVIRTNGGTDAVVWDGTAKVTVEDIPDPLPTTPGERFWGRTSPTDPQWWATRPCEGDDPACSVVYVALQRPWFDRIFDLHADEARDFSLVRLPDPESQS